MSDGLPAQVQRRNTLDSLSKDGKKKKKKKPDEKRAATSSVPFTRAVDAVRRESDEGARIGIGDVATGVTCNVCQELLPGDSALFKHMLANHPDSLYATDDGDSAQSNGTGSLKGSVGVGGLTDSRRVSDGSMNSSQTTFRCREDGCRLKFRSAARLAKHVEEKHSVRSLGDVTSGRKKKSLDEIDLDNDEDIDTATLGAIYGLSRAGDAR